MKILELLSSLRFTACLVIGWLTVLCGVSYGCAVYLVASAWRYSVIITRCNVPWEESNSAFMIITMGLATAFSLVAFSIGAVLKQAVFSPWAYKPGSNLRE